MIKPTLLVLAAGMGSRYGSLKQMDGVGPNGEAIIDYSVYDAIRAGFGKVVFVIRHSFEKEFKEMFSPERFGGRIDVDFVFQELDYLPEGFTVPEGREQYDTGDDSVILERGIDLKTINKQPINYDYQRTEKQNTASVGCVLRKVWKPEQGFELSEGVSSCDQRHP